MQQRAGGFWVVGVWRAGVWGLVSAAWAMMALAAPAYAQGPGSGQNRPPLVLAAASLQESLTRAADVWAGKGHPRPVLAFAASSALARQIENGAPADLFISADEDWMDHVAHAAGRAAGPGPGTGPGTGHDKSGWLMADTRTNLLTNRLALIAPKASPIHLTIAPGFALAAALGADGRLACGQIDAVPAGRYAKQALIALKVWPAVAPRIAGAQSVRAALALVAQGAAPLGIVYETDALAEPRVRIIGLFPASTHAPITYPIAELAGASSPDAQGFRRFLLSSEGRAIFMRYGFGAK